MGKAIGGLPEAAALGDAGRSDELGSAAGPDAAFALGSWMARQRELRGISREELASLTRLPMRSLERFEAGAFDGQQDGFVRGFVRTVAAAIGLDPDDAVARLLAEPAARPRRRGLDPRRVAAAAGALAAVLAVGAVLLGWLRSPPGAEGAAKYEPIVRRDPVRALAIEQGLLDDDRAPDAEPDALPFEPAAPEPEPAADAAAAEAPAPSPPPAE